MRNLPLTFLLLTVCTVVKSKGKISQSFVAFSEYMNFTILFLAFTTQQVKPISNVLQLSYVATLKAQLKFYGKEAQKCKSKGISTLDLQGRKKR